MPEKEQIENHESYMTMNEAGVLVPDYDQTIKIFDDGDIVDGEVVKVDRDEVLVDIGYKSEGAIPARELSIRPDVNPSEVVCVGDRIEALVLQKEDKDGRLILSKKRADYERAWGKIEQTAKSDETVSGVVIEVVKGGLIIDIGLRGFLPASLVDVRRTKDLHQFLGQELECKIIEMDRNRNNVVLSRRAVIENEKKHEKSKILEKIEKDVVLTGKISSIVDFGAFVDLGGIDGLIHISELCWDHIDHPSEVVKVGDEVKVQVLDVDLDRERISLGLRQTQEDPWKEKASKHAVGNIIKGKITKIVPFGSFIEIEEGFEGLIHISELAHKHVELPEEVVKVGDEVDAKIVDISLEKRRISLSIKQAQEPPIEEKTEEGSAAEVTEVPAEAPIETQSAIEETVETFEEVITEEVITEATTAGGIIVETIVEAEEIIEENPQEETKIEVSEEVAPLEPAETVVEVATAEAEDAEVEEVLEELETAAVIEEMVNEPGPDSLEAVLKEMKEKARKTTSD